MKKKKKHVVDSLDNLRAPAEHEERKRIAFGIAGWATFACWGSFFLALILLHFARPDPDYGFFGTFNEAQLNRTQWHETLTAWFLKTLWGCFLLTLSTIIARILFTNREINRDIIVYNLGFLLFATSLLLLAYYMKWLM